MRTWILDTGPLIAYLDRKDPAHREAKRVLDEVPGRLATTSAVVTEAMHFASEVPHGPAFVSEFLTASRVDVFDYAQPAALRRVVPLMERYADTPIDYADATLVLLADDLGVREILTLDRRGFAAFRTPSGGALVNALDLA
jgi:hypothetical protein